MPKRTTNQVVEDWLLNSDWLFELPWSFETPSEINDSSLFDLVCDEPEIAWSIILQILEHPLTEEQESLLAAGPMESLLRRHGSQFIERVEREANRCPRFNHLLGGVWQNTTHEQIWTRVQKARKTVW